ncbi:hypothetical protein HYALB_00004872 [Hymenoscyphus albidus]|uniref:3-beta hydroxysteroid dehydrogenase/isomerase domain-containing protein n=1 Tax=Hymenoscyphus albidus TaxID=595503 RepID=A0A9N9QBD8_9HELO|nr:hypothetical protein HYALB_00004872 [Hymenoscyphus albidus]
MSHSVLIFGGCGFLGCHLVKHFVQTPEFASVHIISRSATRSKFHIDGAIYHTGDLTDPDLIKRLILEIKPDVIVHAATPSAVTGTRKEYELVTIRGTQNLLKISKDSKYLQAFIYTSSSTMAKGAEHLNLTEDCSLANEDPQMPPYARTKAIAEIMVLEANKPLKKPSRNSSWEGHLSTASLRFPITYGSHDTQGIPGCLNALQNRQTNTILGDGKNLWSFCSVFNAAKAHSLLASALLNPDSARPTAAGQAFNINDGHPRLFWSYARTAWKYAGHKPSLNERTWYLPAAALLVLASFLEWFYWIFTIRRKRPFKLGRQQVEYMCFTHTYCIEKARERLGFEPVDDFEGGWRRLFCGL